MIDDLPLGPGAAVALVGWVVSSAVGFGSFLTYLGYGYLDSWHGVGTLLLLPVLVVGMIRARRLLTGHSACTDSSVTPTSAT